MALRFFALYLLGHDAEYSGSYTPCYNKPAATVNSHLSTMMMLTAVSSEIPVRTGVRGLEWQKTFVFRRASYYKFICLNVRECRF
jgi:hypothetical protein